MNDNGLTLAIAVSIPLITAFIGYITNWAAVKMIFHPRDFIGIGPIGWQGVLPARNEKFAHDVAANVGAVLSARELAERLNPRDMEQRLSGRLDQAIPEVVREVAELVRPGLWDEMAPEAQQAIIAQIRTEGSQMAGEIFDDLQGLSEEVLDLEGLVVELLTGDNVDRLVRLFQRMGRKELKAIEYYGGAFGFLVGVLQVLLYSIVNQWYVLPIVGVIVGLGTNWLALKMIFRPLEPRRFFGLVTYQGMFPKRQAEIAREYGEVAAEEIFTPANLFRLVTEGEAGTRIARLVLTKVSDRIDQQRPMVEMLTQTEISDQVLGQVKMMIVHRVTEQVPELQADLEPYVAERLGIAHLVEERLSAMSKAEFERLLRGIFEEDEWILIVIGGALGGVVGLGQAAVVVAQQN